MTKELIIDESKVNIDESKVNKLGKGVVKCEENELCSFSDIKGVKKIEPKLNKFFMGDFKIGNYYIIESNYWANLLIPIKKTKNLNSELIYWDYWIINWYHDKSSRFKNPINPAMKIGAVQSYWDAIIRIWEIPLEGPNRFLNWVIDNPLEGKE